MEIKISRSSAQPGSARRASSAAWAGLSALAVVSLGARLELDSRARPRPNEPPMEARRAHPFFRERSSSFDAGAPGLRDAPGAAARPVARGGGRAGLAPLEASVFPGRLLAAREGIESGKRTRAGVALSVDRERRSPAGAEHGAQAAGGTPALARLRKAFDRPGLRQARSFLHSAASSARQLFASKSSGASRASGSPAGQSRQAFAAASGDPGLRKAISHGGTPSSILVEPGLSRAPSGAGGPAAIRPGDALIVSQETRAASGSTGLSDAPGNARGAVGGERGVSGRGSAGAETQGAGAGGVADPGSSGGSGSDGSDPGLEGEVANASPEDEDAGSSGSPAQDSTTGPQSLGGLSMTSDETLAVPEPEAPIDTTPDATPWSLRKLGAPSDGVARSIEEANKIFITQWGPTAYNRGDAPYGYNDCGPASALMALATAGIIESPKPEQAPAAIDQARDYALGRDTDYSEGMEIDRLRFAVEGFGGKATVLRPTGIATVDSVDAALERGNPIIILGYAWQPWGKALRAEGNYLNSKDPGLHLVAVVGKTAEGLYIVGDPLVPKGAIEVAAWQLNDFQPSPQFGRLEVFRNPDSDLATR